MVYSASVVAKPRNYFRLLAKEQANTLARDVLSRCHRGEAPRLTEGGVIKASRGQSFQVEYDSGFANDRVHFSKVLRIGSLILSTVIFEEPGFIPEEINRQKAALGQLYKENAGNIVFQPPTLYGFTGDMPISPYAHDMIAHMLSESDVIKSADRAIDLGAGDGLLGRLALKLGAKQTLFVENDPDSLEWADGFLRDGFFLDNSCFVSNTSLADEAGMRLLSREYHLDEGRNVFLINIGWPSLYGPANELALKWAMEQNASLIINGGIGGDPANKVLLQAMRTYIKSDGRYEYEETNAGQSGPLYGSGGDTSVLVLRPKR